MVDGTTPEHIQNNVDGRRRQLYAKAREWIDHNPNGWSLLVHRSLSHTQKGEKFSIRQLCEKLRWEQGEVSAVEGESYAIPNEITRYIGWELMRLHPDTRKYMTTREPTPAEQVWVEGYNQAIDPVSTGLSTGVDNYPRGTAFAAVCWVKSVLSAEQPVLVWSVDLETAFGKNEEGSEPDVYEDGRFTDIIDRLKSRLNKEEGTTPLRVRVHTQWRGWVGVEYTGNDRVVVSDWTQLDPPIGRWVISTESRWKLSDNLGMTIDLPSSFFMDGIPF